MNRSENNSQFANCFANCFAQGNAMTSRIPTFALSLLVILLWAGTAFAQVPETLTYQGQLADSSGQPVDDTVEVTFRIYDASSGGSEIWTETQATIDVNGGYLSATLGDSEPLLDAFDGSQRWLEVAINDQTMAPRTELDTVPYALRAASASDADTLGGMTVNDITAGEASEAVDINYDNEVSGLDAQDVQAAIDELAALRAEVLSLQAAVAANESNITDNTDAIADKADASDVSDNANRIDAVQTDVLENVDAIATMSGNMSSNADAIGELQTLTQDMTREEINDAMSVRFDGVNVHVRNGAGSQSEINGTGNLIVGYDEVSAEDLNQTGSHNLVVGADHSYTSHGGAVFGSGNSISSPYATVTGGQSNTASGDFSSVSGGERNEASGNYSSVSGGDSNMANGDFSSVSGGERNEANGNYSSVSGGRQNTASANNSSVSGGWNNEASGLHSSVSGGFTNVASGDQASVCGGQTNTASGDFSSVSGGEGNEASGNSTSVSGGLNRSLSSDHHWRAGNTSANP